MAIQIDGLIQSYRFIDTIVVGWDVSILVAMATGTTLRYVKYSPLSVI